LLSGYTQVVSLGINQIMLRFVGFIKDFILKSLQLDYRFFFSFNSISVLEKVHFLCIKYTLILKFIVFENFILGSSRVKIFGNYFFYNHGLAGIGGLQASLIQHIYLFKKVNLGPSPILVDVGANVGNVSYWFLRMFRDSKVFAIEPSHVSFQALEKNLSIFAPSRVKLFYSLCSSESRKLLNFKIDVKESSLSKISDYSNDSQATKNLVESSTLDLLLGEENLSRIDVLKIDVEGHELEVLIGSKSILSKVHYLHIELNQSNYTIGDMFKLLETHERSIQLVDIRVFEKFNGQIKSADMFLKINDFI
jgi:FkbM family methyltransferase